MIAALTKISLAATVALFAGQDVGLAFSGDYRFATTDRGADGQPVCAETWSFASDGTMTVHSGQEIVQKVWRTETDADGDWLVTRSVSTNGEPDCMGDRSPTVRSGETRTYILTFNAGGMVVCGPPSRTSDGILFVGPTCYGNLSAASD